MTLKEVSIGQTVTVKKLSGQGATKRRIMDMGITKGVNVTVQKVAPLGDPIELTVRGYQLSLRKACCWDIHTNHGIPLLYFHIPHLSLKLHQ